MYHFCDLSDDAPCITVYFFWESNRIFRCLWSPESNPQDTQGTLTVSSSTGLQDRGGGWAHTAFTGFTLLAFRPGSYFLSSRMPVPLMVIEA